MSHSRFGYFFDAFSVRSVFTVFFYILLERKAAVRYGACRLGTADVPVMPALMRISVYEPEFRQYLIYSAEDFGFGVHRVVVVDHAAVLDKTNIESEPRMTELVLPGAAPETVGHGLHERAVTVPGGASGAAGAGEGGARPGGGGEILTVRDLIDDEAAWSRVVDAVAGKHPVYAEDPARALAGFLTHELDTTARVIPGAATMYGFIPGMEEAASALEAVIAEVAP